MGCAQSFPLHLTGPGCPKQRRGMRKSSKGEPSGADGLSENPKHKPQTPPLYSSPVGAKKPNSTLTQLGNRGDFPFQRKPKAERENSIPVGHTAAPRPFPQVLQTCAQNPCCSDLIPGRLGPAPAPGSERHGQERR